MSALLTDILAESVRRLRSGPTPPLPAGVTPIRPTTQDKLDTLIGQQHAARRALIDAILDRDDLIERMARLNPAGVTTKTIETANALVDHAETQHAKVNAILLDAADRLDMTAYEDIRQAMHERMDALTTPSLDDDHAEHRLTRDDVLSHLRSA